ncbi:MAG: hypothetical protein R3C53_02325 [Pirellulaceae bacterium]
MLESAAQNPYAPPTTQAELLAEKPVAEAFRPRTWLASLGIWTLVCILSAAPSFAWGISTISQGQALAMCLGVAIFIAGYVLIDQGTQRMSWRKNEAVRLTFKIGYITRMVISIIFPVGGIVDMFCGLFSVGIASSIYPSIGGADPLGRGMDFGAALLTTIIQGVVLNAVLGGFMIIVLGMILVVQRLGQ